MKKAWAVHPLLIGIFPTLSVAAYNMNQISYRDVFLPLGLALLSSLVLTFLLSRCVRDFQKAAMISSYLLFLFFSYGHFYPVIGNLMGDFRLVFGNFTVGPRKALFMIWCLSLLSGVTYLLLRRKDFSGWTQGMNLLGVILVILPLFQIGAFEFRRGKVSPSDISKEWQEIETQQTETIPPEQARDIYYFIFDRYTNNRVLKEIFGYDNQEFIDALEKRGFFVVSDAYSNYHKSEQSISSSLNMEFLDAVAKRVGEDTGDKFQIFSLLRDYRISRFLKERGYRYVHVGSWWEPTSRNFRADENINLYPMPEFLFEVYKVTVFYHVGRKLGFFDERLIQWKRVIYQFERLKEIPKKSEPTFVFAHMIIPHEPFVFDEDGRFLTIEEDEASLEDSRLWNERFVDQVRFLNKKILEFVDLTLRESKVPPIIVFQGDEGPPPLRYREELTGTFDWRQATGEELRNKMGILNAYYLPDLPKQVLYEGISPVNSFRIIFNQYFNTNLELLPDEHYVALDDHHPLKFFRVTDKLK